MKRKIFTCLLVLLTLVVITGCGSKKKVETPEDNLKIVESEAKKIEYERYDNGLVSMDIPKGWKVDTYPTDYIHYSFKVTNPDDPNYMLLFGLKLEGFLKSDLALKTWKKYYPSSPLSSLPVLSDKTTKGFYSIWNDTAKVVNKDKANYYPTIKDLNVVENLGQSPMVGGDVLRVTYKSADDKDVQALVTASVKDIGSYYINVNWNPLSKKVDVWPLNVYNVIVMSAPDEDFVNYQPILDHTLGSMEFSEKFIKGFNKEETTLVNTIKANQKIYDQVSDMIMDSWNKRNASYDIISQKRSDATLGYERVYNTETGDVYKAYNGFTDEYHGSVYQTATDDMYTKSISGYIEK